MGGKMSVVTDCILMYDLEPWDDHLVLDQINAFFTVVRGFVHVDATDGGKWYGGTKALQANVAIGAFNHLNLDGLLQHIRNNVEWGEVEWAQLCVQGEYDENGFTLHRLRGNDA
jgi:hypothetical protein